MNLTKLLLVPLFVHVVLVLFVGIDSLRARIKSIKSGATKLHEIAHNSNAWPARVKKYGDNFDNQFQTPMLWYGVSALVVALHFEDLVFIGLSWLFMLTRVAHTYIQTSHNEVPARMRVFVMGFITLVTMWLWLAVRLYLIG